MKSLHTLTVPDVMWVNMQICRKQEPWNYATLEEAVFNQYSYGGSEDLAAQAARFLTGFMKLKPFRAGNEATAFVGAIAFLAMNGKVLHLSDDAALEWVQGVWADGTTDGAQAKIEVLLEEHDLHLHEGDVPNVRGILGEAMAKYAATLGQLIATGHQAVLV